MTLTLEELQSRGLVMNLTFTDRETGEVVTRHVIKYEGLLLAARSSGLRAIRTRVVQSPSKDNRWTTIVAAEVEVNDGHVFSGIGDANPDNVNGRIRPHCIRMAETRAKARALRDAIDLHGVVCFDELETDAPAAPHRGSRDRKPQQQPVNGRNNGQARFERNGNGYGRSQRPMTDRQRSYLLSLLADEGLDGSAAQAELRRSFGTDDLESVSAAEASQLIESLAGH